MTAACLRGDAAREPAGDAAVPEARRYGGTAVVGATADVDDISPLTWSTQTAQYLQSYLQPFTLLYYPRRLEGVANRLRDVYPDARGDLVGVERWWLEPGSRRGGGG